MAEERRRRALLRLGAVAIGVHLLALSGLHWAWPQPEVAPAVRVEVRALPPPVPAAAARPARPVAARETATSPVATAPTPIAAPPPRHRVAAVRASPEPPAPVRPADTPVPAAPAQVVAAAPDDEPLPRYRTLIPPAATLRYRVQKGASEGSAELHWRPAADRYELTLDLEVGGAPALVQASRGSFDEAGIAPLRFTDKRLRRPASAANFQRDTGDITFSGPSIRVPLSAGSQDRLSWLLQLPAIVAAEPSLREPGAKVVMNVAGAGGDVAVWVFRCHGATAPGEGPADALVYRREPRGPYDTAAAAWLDPRRGFLPVQATWKSGASDPGIELRLQEMTQGP